MHGKKSNRGLNSVCPCKKFDATLCIVLEVHLSKTLDLGGGGGESSILK